MAPDSIPSIIVRPMVVADIDQVAVLDKLSFSTPWPPRTYRYEIESNKSSTMIVLEDARAAAAGPPSNGLESLFRRLAGHPAALDPVNMAIVGFAGMWQIADEAHISTIAVSPLWRGKRLGELMIWTMVRQALWKQASMVTLEVRVSNTVAQALYRKYGFEIIGRRKGYYRDNREDAYNMQMILDGATHSRMLAFRDALVRRLTVIDRMPDPRKNSLALTPRP